MPSRERVDTPSWIISAAEKFQALQDRVALSGLTRLIAGSSSPLYEQIRWRGVDEVIDAVTRRPTELPVIPGDPEASIFTSVLPRLKHNAAVLGANKALPTTRDELAAEYGPARVAIAYTYDDKTHVGVLPGEITSLESQVSRSYQAAMRIGRSDFGAAIGVWLLNERVFVPSPDSFISNPSVPLENLPYGYPNIRLL